MLRWEFYIGSSFLIPSFTLSGFKRTATQNFSSLPEDPCIWSSPAAILIPQLPSIILAQEKPRRKQINVIHIQRKRKNYELWDSSVIHCRLFSFTGEQEDGNLIFGNLTAVEIFVFHQSIVVEHISLRTFGLFLMFLWNSVWKNVYLCHFHVFKLFIILYYVVE